MATWGGQRLLGLCLVAMGLASLTSAQMSLWGPETAWTWSSWSTLRLKFPYSQIVSADLDEGLQHQSDIGPGRIEGYIHNRKLT